jgi:uncharacterized protein (DUF433 family)
MLSKSERLESLAESENIQVIDAPLPYVKAAMLRGSGQIVIDQKKINSSIENAEKLAHELGHYFTDAYYTPLCPLQTKGRCEGKAASWAIREMLPVEKIREALAVGLRNYWEFADEFDLSEAFVKKALEYYARKGEI